MTAPVQIDDPNLRTILEAMPIGYLLLVGAIANKVRMKPSNVLDLLLSAKARNLVHHSDDGVTNAFARVVALAPVRVAKR